jgi:hypothetical protein
LLEGYSDAVIVKEEVIWEMASVSWACVLMGGNDAVIAYTTHVVAIFFPVLIVVPNNKKTRVKQKLDVGNRYLWTIIRF